MRMPTFFVIGAAKCGTTSLWRYLREHPDVHMSRKPTSKYFIAHPDTCRFAGPREQGWFSRLPTREQYLELFSGVTDEKAVGDVTCMYLQLPWVAGRIREEVPGARIVASLRDPADRTYSDYVMRVRRGWEDAPSFLDAVRDEPRRVAAGWGPRCTYLDAGYYYKHLRVYNDTFPPENIRVHLLDDMRKDAAGVMRGLFEFLEVCPDVLVNTTAKHNEGYAPKNRKVLRFVHRGSWLRTALGPLLPRSLKARAMRTIEKANRTAIQPMPLEAREYLLALYREDTLRLQDLLDRDLSSWLTVDRSAPMSLAS